jgi:hypothetical protein
MKLCSSVDKLETLQVCMCVCVCWYGVQTNVNSNGDQLGSA